MALQISTYTDPGVYIDEVIAPGAQNLQTLPVLPAVIANGSRVRRIVNEDITRGRVTGESLTVAGTSPHTATLSGRGNRRLGDTTVFADGVALSPSRISYPAATLTSANTETFDLSTNNAIVIEMDGNTPITLTFAAGSSATAVSGTQVDVTTTLSGTSGDAATAAEVAAGINAGLVAASALGYGSAYSAAASASGGAVVLTSPISGALSNIKLQDAVSASATSAVFGASLQSATVVRISDVAFESGAVYTASYVDLDDTVDATAQTTSVTSFARVGAFPGTTTYREDTDFTVPSAGNLNWTAALTTASTTSTAETFDLSTNDVIQLAFDGRAAVDVDLNGLSSAPLGYVSPSAAGAATAAEVAANINAVIGNSATYGPDYAGVATASGGIVTLTSPTAGTTGSVAITHPSSLDATTEVFGLAASATLTVTGSGTAPAAGSVYYATYDYTRPSADYNAPQQFFTLDQALTFTGPLAADNPLAIGVEIAFRNGANSVVAVQVNDATPGSPTPLEFQAALDAAATRSTITDVVVLSTSLDVQARLQAHVENQSSFVEKNYRRGYFGMPVNTAIGDLDTADTFVFRAAQTLQTAADSPARGRFMLVAPPGVEGVRKQLLLSDGSTTTVTLDSTYLACAIAGRLASFLSPADALVRTNLAGFRVNESDFTPWVRAERAQLARNGVTVVTFDAGRYTLLDPVSTERAGGALIQFEQWSASVQKDNIVRKVTASLDANVVGLVPLDTADFIVDIKLYIAGVLTRAISEGAIGPFTDPSGARRALDLNQDIQVEQSASDPTQYNFNFFFNLRYPALRLFGQYSVDVPFFSQTA